MLSRKELEMHRNQMFQLLMFVFVKFCFCFCFALVMSIIAPQDANKVSDAGLSSLEHFRVQWYM